MYRGVLFCCARTESQLLGFRQDSNTANQQVSVKRDFAKIISDERSEEVIL
jgi:hypothetical protein